MNNKQSKKCCVAPRTDNKPPHFNPSLHLRVPNLRQDATRMKEIDKENMRLLKKINIINRLGVSIAVYVCARARVKLMIYSHHEIHCVFNLLLLLDSKYYKHEKNIERFYFIFRDMWIAGRRILNINQD